MHWLSVCIINRIYKPMYSIKFCYYTSLCSSYPDFARLCQQFLKLCCTLLAVSGFTVLRASISTPHEAFPCFIHFSSTYLHWVAFLECLRCIAPSSSCDKPSAFPSSCHLSPTSDLIMLKMCRWKSISLSSPSRGPISYRESRKHSSQHGMYRTDLHVDWFAICTIAQCTWWITGWWEMSNFNVIVISFIFAPGGSTFSIPTTDKINFNFFVKAISCGRMTWYLTHGRGCPGTNSSTSLSSIYEQKIRLVTS